MLQFHGSQSHNECSFSAGFSSVFAVEVSDDAAGAGVSVAEVAAGTSLAGASAAGAG